MLTAAILGVVFALGISHAVWLYNSRKRAIVMQRVQIQGALLQHAVSSGDPRLCFSPSSALLVREREEVRGESAICVQTHRIYRNDSNEYFLFFCTAGEPGYLTHLTKDRARDALRSDPAIFRREFPNA